jgi:6-phosphogluconate dehydrogenase
MQIIISGLGRMGAQIAEKLADGGHRVIANNRSRGPIELAIKYKAEAAYTKQDALALASSGPVILWLMITDSAVDEELSKWLELIPRGSILIDGGNSDFRLTQKRSFMVKQSGSTLLDVGTSGGVWGYRNGFSMMAGGEKSAFKKIEPVLKTLAAPTGAYRYFGKSGSGHFVKMVHNAIEYGMMQSLAEGYRILEEGPYESLDLAAAGEVWQHNSVITSWLNELTRQALAENPKLDGIAGVVAESGEARWTLELANELKIPMPAIEAAFNVRKRSQHGDINFSTKLLAAMRNKFGGHSINPPSD